MVTSPVTVPSISRVTSCSVNPIIPFNLEFRVRFVLILNPEVRLSRVIGDTPVDYSLWYS